MKIVQMVKSGSKKQFNIKCRSLLCNKFCSIVIIFLVQIEIVVTNPHYLIMSGI